MAHKTSQSDKEHMKQSTSFAQVATNLLNVLQGYSKTLRLLLVMFLTLTVSAEVWGAEQTYTHKFATKPSIGNNTLSTITWRVEATNLNNYNNGYAGVQFGTKDASGSITLTSANAWGEQSNTLYTGYTNVKYVYVWLNAGTGTPTATVTIGGKAASKSGTVSKNTAANSDYKKTSKLTFTPASGGNTGVIVITASTSSKAGYIAAIEVVCETPAASCTSINPSLSYTPSPLSVGGTANPILSGNTGNGTVTYTSSNTSVATINASTGVVTAVSAGSATITASIAAKGSYCDGVATATIKVNKQSATIVLSEAGTENTVSGTFYKDDSYTLPSSTDAKCGDKVLIGWSTVEIDETDTQPTSNYYDKETSVSLKAGENKFYAVFATKSETTGGTTTTPTTASLSFASTAQRTSYSTSKQVWEQNGITLTNDKGSSTSNVADYANPARFYKSSKITLSFTYAMTQIVFTCSSSEYATDLKNSIKSGATVTASGSTVTAELTEPATSFVISSLSGQVRMNSVEVTYNKTTTGGTTVTYSDYTTSCTTKIVVTLNPNGGTISTGDWAQNGTKYTQTVETTNDFTLPTPQKTGYTFGGWFENSTFSGSDVTKIEAGTTGTKEFWAKWTPTTYTITYENLGGASNTNPTRYTIESEAINFVDPGIRDGYIFKGWEPASLAKGSIGNQIVTAKWCEILGDATGLSVQTDYVENGLTYVKFSWTPADNTKSHASKQVICIGKVGEEKKCTDLEENQVWIADLRSKLSPGEYEWTIQAIGDGTDYCDGEVIAGANFTIIGYVISFDTDGGDGEYNDVTIFEGETYTIPVAPTKTGYTFKGWSDGTNLYQPGAEISNLTEDLTLTAIWLTTTTLSWSEPTCTATIASPSNVFPELTTTPADLQGVQYSSSEPTVATIDANGNIRLLTAGETTITANFVENATHAASSAEYTLTVVASDNCKWVETDINDIESGDEVVVTMTKEGDTYAMSNNRGTTIAPEATVITVKDGIIKQVVETYNQWTIVNDNNYLVFYADASNRLYGNKADDGLRVGSANNALTNHEFFISNNYLVNKETSRYVGVNLTKTEWYCYQTNTGNIKDQTLKFYKKTCLPANEYWVTYDLENVTCTTDPRVETVTSTSEGFEVTFAANDGYVLTDDIEVQMVGGTLTTTWDKDNGVLTINKPDGGFTGNITISLAACLSLAAPENLAANEITSSSVTLSWDAVADAQSYEVLVLDENNDEISKTTTECQITLTDLQVNSYYVWGVTPVADGYCGIQETSDFQTLQTYDVTFNNNGHINAELMPATQTVDDGSLAQEPADDPSDNGYSFGGWYDNKNCEGEPFSFLETPITANTVLYAKWDVVTYNITYAGLEGATNHADNPASYTIETPTITFLAPSTRSGYIFSGWNPATLEKGSYGNKTITATWEKGKIVTWKADGNVIKQQTYALGDKLVLPTEEIEACQGSAFMGWTAEQNYSHATDAPAYVTAGNAVNADATYYAVYANVDGESEEVTMQYASGSTTNMTGENDAATIGLDASEWSVIASKGNSNNYPGLNKDGTIRLYYNANGSNYITITCSSKKITDVEIIYKNSYNEGLVIVEGNTVSGKELSSDNSVQIVKYPINSDEFVIKNGHTNGSQEQVRITQVLIQTGTTTYTNYSTTCSATYYVNYDFAEGEGSCEDGSVTAGGDYIICNVEPTKTGYTFKHWTDGTNTYAAGATIEDVQKDITLTAIWEANTYTITWMSNGVEYITTTHTYDQALELPADPYTCYGAKTFVGWTEVNENGEGIELITTSTNPSTDKTYYAVFADEEVGEPEKHDATLSFASTAQRTSFSSEQQVWEQNGIVLTNTKGSGNNDAHVADYADPARFYAASSINIAAPGNITKIVFTCSGESYVDDMQKSAGNSATADGTVVTVNLDGSSNTFEIAKVTAQIRLSSLTVTYLSTPETILTNYTTSPTDCPEIEVAENAYVTSTSGQSVKVNVPITANHFADDITLSATIEGETNFAVVNTSTITDGICTLSIAYKPTSYNLTESAIVTLTAKVGETLITSNSFTIHGRSLPENFVIATKVGATWYALPANMNGATNPEGIVIDVDETNMTAIAPNTTVYTLFPVATVNGDSDRYKEYGERLRFAAVNNGNRGLWANDAKNGTTINNDAAITAANSTAGAAYEWKITTTIVDGNWQYTLQTDQSNNQKYLRYWTAASGGAKWGTYASGNDKLYFLPVTETKPFDYKVVEWYPTKVLIQTEAAITNPIVKIGGVLVDNVTCTNKGGKLYEISGLPLVNNPTKVLTLSYTADEVTYTSSKVVPIILSRETKSISGEPFVALTKEVYNYADLVVRDGAILTMDGTQEANTLWDVTIYPTSKISVPSDKKLTVHSLTFFGGIDEIYNGSTYTLNKYGVPELSLKGNLKKSISTIDYLMRVNLDQMYSLSVPYDVQLADIKYWDGSDIALGDALYVSAYDGAARANQSKKTWIYETDFNPATLKAGVGYTISAELQSGVGSEYSILRMPMNSNIANDATEGEKKVSVTAHGIDANITDNHKGWNLVGNPYMTTITGADDADLVLGKLQETGTGPWEWVEKTYRYVTIPSDDGTYYWQQKFTDAVLPPFKNFFVQVGTTGELVFDLGTRKNMRAHHSESSVERDVEFEILMSNATRQDNTGLLISEGYSPAYEINADLEKMIGSMSVYTIYGGYKLAYNALSPINASEWIPMGYIAPAAGEYTFRIDDVDKIMEQVEHVYVIDYDANNIVDLMTDEYKFTTNKEQNNNRFAINIVLIQDKDNTTTGMDIINGNVAAPIKFIYHDKMYIYNEGIIYDATGKQVANINK